MNINGLMNLLGQHSRAAAPEPAATKPLDPQAAVPGSNPATTPAAVNHGSTPGGIQELPTL